MIRLFTLFVILTTAGCQTVPTHKEKEIKPSKAVVTVLVEQFDRSGNKIEKVQSSGSEYRITVKWSEYKSNGTKDVLSSPMMSGKPNKWSTLRIGTPPPNLKSTISYLIESEKIELQTVYGVNLTSKIVPNSVEQTVQAKGIIAISKKGKSGELIRKSVPFNVNCNLNETIAVYETEIKLEPAH